MIRRLDRRTLLRGIGHAAIALPALEIMSAGRAAAQAGKRMRYVVAFGGLSPKSGYPPTGGFGAGWGLSVGLRPLGGRAATPVAGRPAYAWDGVKDAFNVVSGLRVPTGSAAGAYRGAWHSGVVGPLLCGVSTAEASPHPGGITSDMVVAKAQTAATPFRWLGYRVQPESYRLTTNNPGSGVMSHDGKAVVTPVHSPRAAYDQLFRDFAAPAPVGSASSDPRPSDLGLVKNRSVIDLVKSNADRLAARLGKADRARLDEHFTQIREMERRLARIDETPAGRPAGCARPPQPAEDPAKRTNFKNDFASNRVVGYSGEDDRARVMCDLVHMAFTCDMTRAVSLMFTYPSSFMTVEPILGDRRVDVHDLGHSSSWDADCPRIASWHVEHVARLADLLRKTPEEGSNLLDRTVIVFVTEGGCSGTAHSAEKSCVIVGGGREGGLVQGQHINGNGRHPAHVLVSAMRGAGVATDALGEVQGRIQELHG